MIMSYFTLEKLIVRIIQMYFQKYDNSNAKITENNIFMIPAFFCYILCPYSY